MMQKYRNRTYLRMYEKRIKSLPPQKKQNKQKTNHTMTIKQIKITMEI